MKNKTAPGWDPTSIPTFWVNHVSRLLMRRFEQLLRPLRFGFAYLPVAVALDENGNLLQRDLAETAHVEQPTMAALLARMERDGLIVRQPHPLDRRASSIALSREGKTRLPKAKERLVVAVEEALEGFTADEIATLTRLLRRMAKNLGEDFDKPDGRQGT